MKFKRKGFLKKVLIIVFAVFLIIAGFLVSRFTGKVSFEDEVTQNCSATGIRDGAFCTRLGCSFGYSCSPGDVDCDSEMLDIIPGACEVAGCSWDEEVGNCEGSSTKTCSDFGNSESECLTAGCSGDNSCFGTFKCSSLTNSGYTSACTSTGGLCKWYDCNGARTCVENSREISCDSGASGGSNSKHYDFNCSNYDINGDGTVDDLDKPLFAALYNKFKWCLADSETCEYHEEIDFNHDGFVNSLDIPEFKAWYSAGPSFFISCKGIILEGSGSWGSGLKGAGSLVGSGIKYSLTRQEFLAGSTKALSKTDKVEVLVVNNLTGQEEKHEVLISDLNLVTNSIIVIVSSEPQQVILNIGEEQNFDVNEDGLCDVYIKFSHLIDGKAIIIMKESANGLTCAFVSELSDKENSAEEVLEEGQEESTSGNNGALTGQAVGGSSTWRVVENPVENYDSSSITPAEITPSVKEDGSVDLDISI